MHRDEILFNHGQKWDVIVIGGGITGAGVFRAMSSLGLRCLLIEQRDFAFGTSSRSGKLVHGGLRYLKQGQFMTTFHSVRARERMIEQYHGLVVRIPFLIPTFRDNRWMAHTLRAGLITYDVIAGSMSHRKYHAQDVAVLAPCFRQKGLTGGFLYNDARTDDARLVLRVIQDGIIHGGVAVNYVAAQDILRNHAGRVVGVRVMDERSSSTVELFSEIVINATGVWADEMRGKLGHRPKLRKLRGSHIVFPRWRFPVSVAINVFHPRDKRPLYIVPWEDATLVGTTDIDHEDSLQNEPRMSKEEGLYLLEALHEYFPGLGLCASDILSTFSGVRPVINTGKQNPSRESREHVVWMDDGLMTVTGGKLTTYHLLVDDAVREAKKWFAHWNESPSASNEKKPHPIVQERLIGVGREGIEYQTLVSRFQTRYHSNGYEFLDTVDKREWKQISGTQTVWAELRWAARNESVEHLEDLLLRRTRIGLMTPKGGLLLMHKIKDIVQEELGWDDSRFHAEVCAYESTWKSAYNPGILL